MCASKTKPQAVGAVSETAPLLLEKNIALLGAGRLGETLLAGLLEAGTVQAERITATAAHQARLQEVAQKFAVRTTLQNCDAVQNADVVLLTVKPQIVEAVLLEICDVVREQQLILSSATGVPTAFMERVLRKKVPIVRAMPNTPCLVRGGMTGICAGAYADHGHLEMARQVFGCLGRTIIVDERHMDAVTGLSASGPAYIYIVIESLAEGGVKVGLPRDVATLLAAQTVLGAAAMVLETGEHPARLKDTVTTPAGCTIDGILELEEGGLRVALIKAVVRATQRAKELLHG